MKAAKTGSEEARATEPTLATAPLDSGETRAVVLAATAIAIFLYFIKAILLPSSWRPLSPTSVRRCWIGSPDGRGGRVCCSRSRFS
jgi:hypothetical protein